MGPPKNKGGNKKSKGAGDEDGGSSSSKPKAAQSINVRHILVGTFLNHLRPDGVMLISPSQTV
jgi:hypothetical protein